MALAANQTNVAQSLDQALMKSEVCLKGKKCIFRLYNKQWMVSNQYRDSKQAPTQKMYFGKKTLMVVLHSIQKITSLLQVPYVCGK
jgi:hypothetical protein